MFERKAEDNFLSGYHDIPDKKRLRRMSDIQLDSLLFSSKNEPVKAAAIQREIDRKAQPWYQKPLGLTALSFVSGLLVAAAVFFFGWN